MRGRASLWVLSVLLVAAVAAIVSLISVRDQLQSELTASSAGQATALEAERDRAAAAELTIVALERELEQSRQAADAAEGRLADLEREIDTLRGDLAAAAEPVYSEPEAVAPEPVVVASYIAPDPATLRRVVTETFRSQLGREPRDHELEAQATLLGDLHREEFDALQAGLAFDLVSRYVESFESDYSGELENYRTRDERARQNQLVRDNFDAMQCFATGNC
jgi:hypothetical protein